jgi:hypothetical protein
MAIAFAGSASNTAVSGTPVSVTYTPTPGNMLIAFVGIGGSTSNGLSVQDNNGQFLAGGPSYNGSQNPTPGGTGFLYSFWGIAQAGATSYIANWDTAQVSSMVIAEYSGAEAIYFVPQVWYNTGAGVSAAINETTTNPNAWIVGGFMNNDSSAFSSARESTSGVTACVALADSGNVPVVNTSTTVGVTQASGVSFGALAFQLSPFSGAGYNATVNPTGAIADATSFGLILFGGLAAMKSPYLGGGKSSGDSGVITGNNYPPYGQIFPRL